MSPHTDAGELLKLADEIERACKAPSYEARLGTIEGKMVVAGLRLAASQGRAGGERSEVQTDDPNPLSYWQMMYYDLLKRVDAGEFSGAAQEASDCGAEIKRLRAQVEYWRLAAERREARMERSGVDVAEASTLDAPSVPSASSPAQASRDVAIEECAKVAESFRRQMLPGDDRVLIRKIEDAIRSLSAVPSAHCAAPSEGE